MKKCKIVIVLLLGLIPVYSVIKSKPYDRQNLSELSASVTKLKEELKKAKSESERRRIQGELDTANYWYSYRHWD